MVPQFSFAERIAPYFRLNGRDYYRIHGTDKNITGAAHLFFAANAGGTKALGVHGREMHPGEWLAANSLRNSLFVEPLAQLTRVRDVSLVVEYEGALILRVQVAVPGRAVEVLKEVKLFSARRTHYVVQVGSLFDMPEQARLFWHAEGLTGGGRLYEAAFCTADAPREPTRLAVMMRTYGRTGDVLGVLKRFADGAADDPYYASVLDNVDFWVLDTSGDVEAEYRLPWLAQLNVRVLVGPNLGGGGNAGHMLQLFENACDKAGAAGPTELLILDDDLAVSMETLARYFMFAAYRTREVICSLPVLMKSRATTVWEDGGYWGRFNFHEGGSFGRERNLFPNLLKHGLQVESFEAVDSFCSLNTCEYSTFIFFGLPMALFRKLGCPAAFFLRGDDIEYSLRAQERGMTMVTNPNLAAWHEPAHSYGQEYMAILHGVIVNLTYGEHGADFYRRFFEGRLYEHGSIDDLVGMRLYRDILAVLIDSHSPVLGPDFHKHYVAKIKEYGAVKAMKLPESDRERYERLAVENKTLIVPFVYPGYHKDISKFRSVVLVNPSVRSYRELPACPVAEKAALMAEYAQLLARFVDEFERISKFWVERLQQSSSAGFWKDIVRRHAGETREILASRRGAANAAGPVLGEEISDAPNAAAGASRAMAPAAVGATAATPAAAAPRAAAAGPARSPLSSAALPSFGPRAEPSNDGLPADFDAEMYLHINPDVKQAGYDAGKHYLEYGRKERRQYRI